MFRRVLLRESSHAGIIIPRTEVVRPALYIEILAAVPKWVRVGAHAVFFVAESVVIICFDAYSAGVGKIYHIPVSVEGVVFGCACGAGDEIRAAEIGGRKRVLLQLGNDISAVQQIARQRVPRQLRRADAILW